MKKKQKRKEKEKEKNEKKESKIKSYDLKKKIIKERKKVNKRDY